eukprot:g9401.t1
MIIPQVVEARQKEIQGLYDAKYLECATWQYAERDRVKPIRTGFVDAIKEDEATALMKPRHLWHNTSSSSRYAHCWREDDGRRWHFSPIDSLRREERQHEELVKKLGEANFRFTDNGEVEDRGFENAKPSTTPCTEQEPQPADPDASIRQWPLRKLAGCAYTCTESRTWLTEWLAEFTDPSRIREAYSFLRILIGGQLTYTLTQMQT